MPLGELARKILRFLHRFAVRLQPWRNVFFVLSFVFALMAVYGLFDNSVYPASWLQFGLSGLLWCLMVLATIELFQVLPAIPQPTQPFFQRVKLRIARAFYYLLSIVIVISTLLLLATSIRLLRL